MHSLFRSLMLESRAILAFLLLVPVCLYGHNENVHREITKSAYASSAASTAFLTDYFGVSQDFSFGPPILAQPSPLQGLINGFSPVNWLIEGSYYEDMTYYGSGRLRDQWRTLDHFFVPWPSAHGLTDDSDAPWYAFGLWPGGIVHSFGWGTTPGLSGPDVPTATFANTETWQNAREHEFRVLTQGSKVSRDESLALMLYALGHVLHLNQDTSSPDHTRDDSHKLRAYFEDYGGDTYLVNANKSPTAHAQAFPLRPRGWDSWRAGGFQKLRDFWERRLYNNSEQVLKTALDRDAASAPGMQ